MYSFLSRICLIVLIFLPNWAFPADESVHLNSPAIVPVVNGCGSGWNTWLVPDSIPIACDFTAVCNDHDICYGKCEGRYADKLLPECEYLRCRKGGDLFDSTQCKTLKFVRLVNMADGRKLQCDKLLYEGIRDLNKDKPVCNAFAVVYRFAVKQWGKSAFFGVDPFGRVVKQPREEYDKAIKDFFRYGTPDQFERLTMSVEDGTVDFAAPIEFDKVKGLINKSRP